MSSQEALIKSYVEMRWNDRYRALIEMMHIGNKERTFVVEVLETLRDLQDLSYGEKKLLDKCRNYEAWKKEQEAKLVASGELAQIIPFRTRAIPKS